MIVRPTYDFQWVSATLADFLGVTQGQIDKSNIIPDAVDISQGQFTQKTIF